MWKRNRAWPIGFLLGYAAHVLTDINDSVGTMLLFPFSTLNWTSQTWAYAATVEGGKYLDAAAYYSSLGLVMDLFWLIVVLFSWRVLTREYWRTHVVPADAARLGVARPWFCPNAACWRLPRRLLLRRVPDDRLDDVGAPRRPSRSSTASSTDGYPFDLSWTGPRWIPALSLRHVNPWLAYPVAIALFAWSSSPCRSCGNRWAAPSNATAPPAPPAPTPVAVSEPTGGWSSGSSQEEAGEARVD